MWLWAARFYKTRSLAKHAVETGKVDVGGQRAKASRAVRVGDVLRVVRGEEIFEVGVLALSDTRGPASTAQTLYAESDASKLAREQAACPARRRTQRLSRAGEQTGQACSAVDSSAGRYRRDLKCTASADAVIPANAGTQ